MALKIFGLVVLLLGVTYGSLRVAGAWRQGQSVKEAGRRLRAGAPLTSFKVSHAELDQANVPPIAVAVLTFPGITVRGIFGFADDGRPLTFDADRPMDEKGKSIPTPWHVVYESHAILSGMEIPKRGNVSWLLPAGPFEYGQFEITSLDVEPSPAPAGSASGT